MVLIGIVTFTLMATNGHAEGYLYLFFYSIPSNTAISVFPHEPVLIWYGTIANIWLASLAATAESLDGVNMPDDAGDVKGKIGLYACSKFSLSTASCSGLKW